MDKKLTATKQRSLPGKEIKSINKMLKELEEKVEVSFKDKKLLEQALTHKSYAYIHGTEDNERLEFLGDSVLDLVVSEYLYMRYPNYDEGKLTQLKSGLVNRKSLSLWAKRLSLGKYLFLSQEEEGSGGRKRESLLSNALEALIGAIYQDSGIEKVKEFILSQISRVKVRKADYKSKLQELVQKKYKILPEYTVRTESGPAHRRLFEIEVRVKNKVLGHGTGWSKKSAEQEAAKEAIRKMEAP